MPWLAQCCENNRLGVQKEAVVQGPGGLRPGLKFVDMVSIGD